MNDFNKFQSVDPKYGVNPTTLPVFQVQMQAELFGIDEMAEAICRQIETNYRIEVSDLQQEMLAEYLKSLFYLTVVSANQDKVTLRKHRMWRRYQVPVVWQFMLSHVGNVIDRQSNIDLRVAPLEDTSVIMEPEQMERVSDFLYRFPQSIETCDLQFSKEGDLEFMSMNIIEGEIVSRACSQPYHALITAVIKKKTVERAYQNMCRVTYGSVGDLEIVAKYWFRDHIRVSL